MSENSTADFKTTNLEIDFDIGGVRYRAELIIDKVEKDNVNIPETEDLRQNDEMDDMQHNVQGNENENPDQSMRHTIKFCAGPKSVSLSRVLSPEGELEFRKTGDGVDDDDITEFAENWIMRVAPLFITEQGMIELNLDFLGLMQFLELVSYFAPIQEPFPTSEYDVGDENPFQPEDPTSTSKDPSTSSEDTSMVNKDKGNFDGMNKHVIEDLDDMIGRVKEDMAQQIDKVQENINEMIIIHMNEGEIDGEMRKEAIEKTGDMVKEKLNEVKEHINKDIDDMSGHVKDHIDDIICKVKENLDEMKDKLKVEDSIVDENKVIETYEDASSSSEDSTSGSEDSTPAYKDPTSRSEDPNNQ